MHYKFLVNIMLFIGIKKGSSGEDPFCNKKLGRKVNNLAIPKLI